MRTAPTWGDAPLPSYKFDRNALEIPRYAGIERRFASVARDLVSAYQAGRIDKPELMVRFKESLQEAETHAFVAGRRARNVASLDITDQEAAMLAGRHSRNMRYFSGFVDDMDNGRGRMPYGDRAELYAKSLWSLFTRGETTDWDDPNENARYWWIMDTDAEHCPTCLERAKQCRDEDGFSWERLTEVGWPGEHTICQVNCRCHIRVIRKRTVVPERMEDLHPAPTPEEGRSVLEELLGGQNMPLTSPAAGVPYVRITPQAVDDSLAMDQSGELGNYLPMLPVAMTSPTKLIESADSRVYEYGDLTAITERSQDDGIWRLIAAILHRKAEG